MVLLVSITDLLDKMIVADSPSEVWKQSGLSIVPIERLKTTLQRNNQTVFDHSMEVLDCLPVKNHVTILSAIFHDSGKPDTRMIEVATIRPGFEGVVHFWGHEIVSTQIASRILKILSVDKNIINKVLGIITTHMFDIKGNIGRRAIEKFIITVGKDNLDNWFAVRQADALCYQGPNLSSKDYLEKTLGPFEKKVRDELGDKPETFIDPIIGLGDSHIILTGEESAET